MRAIDVPAGAGGLSLGLARAGFDLLGVDHDRHAVAAHLANVGPCELADMASWHPPHQVELVAGGVPCQPFSTQGKRRGMAEEVGPLFPGLAEPRAHLFRHLIRIGVEAGARVLLLENVRGLLSWNGGEAIERIAGEMRAAGFAHVDRRVLDAADYGTPQHRERVFVVAFRRQEDAARFAWPEPTHGPDRPLPWVTVRQALDLGGEPDGGALDRPARTITSSTHDETPDASQPSRRYGPILRAALSVAGILDRPCTAVVATAGGRLARAGHKSTGDQWAGAVKVDAEACARLQGFAPGLVWPRTENDAHRVIGNAVPPQLGAAVGSAIAASLRRVARGEAA